MRATAIARPGGRSSERSARAPGSPNGGAAVTAPSADPDHRDAIVESHARCAALGVSRIDSPDLSLAARADLAVALERNRRLHEHAAPVMAVLHDQIERTESMVVLTDSTGTIIHAVGDDDFLSRASQVALHPGANWSEGNKGTNAVGTALVDEKPTLVHADEHYLHANSFLTCSAAPILDPRGSILGVLDVSGDFHSYHKHTLALVRMSARMIENRWLTEDFGQALRLHLHARPDFIGTIMEGILAVSASGRIVGANRGALEQIGLSGAAVRMHSLATLFDVSLEAVVDHCRARVATPLALRLANGQVLSAFARCSWPVWARAHGTRGQGTRADASSADLSEGAPALRAPAREARGQRNGPARDVGADLDAHQGAGRGADTRALPTPSAPSPRAGQGGALAALRTGDPAYDAVIDKLVRVLDKQVPVVLLGEPGVGKQTLARAMHADSARAARAFVVVDGALLQQAPSRGALPGAGLRDKLAEARGGTLYIDEIGALDAVAQALLVQVLADPGRVTGLTNGAANGPAPVALPVPDTERGPARRPRPARGEPPNSADAVAPITVISASRHAPRDLIEQRLLRDDLYYRLNGLALRVPALRERKDLARLVRHIGTTFGAAELRLAPEVASLFAAHPWPGNLRQLQQVLRATCLVASLPHAVIARAHLPDDFLMEAAAATGAPTRQASGPASRDTPRPAAPDAAPPDQGAGGPALGRTLDAVELDLIRRTLAAVGGNISEASKRLGISRNTIYRKLRWNAPAAG